MQGQPTRLLSSWTEEGFLVGVRSARKHLSMAIPLFRARSLIMLTESGAKNRRPLGREVAEWLKAAVC
jgi:hypothetical protein